MKLILALLSLSTLLFVSAPEPAFARSENTSRWHSFCEQALGATERIKAGWRSFQDEASRAFQKVRFNAEMIVALTFEWLDRFDDGLTESNLHAAEFHGYKWAHPYKIAHALNRTGAMLESLAAMFGSEEERADFNHRFLAWELQHYEDSRGYMKSLKPKYISNSLDDVLIDRMVRRSFPNFRNNPTLRALEVIVSPIVLFGKGKRLPRIYRRPTLLILRGDLVVKSYPTLEGAAEETFSVPVFLPKSPDVR